jgi:hypothetical protein
MLDRKYDFTPEGRSEAQKLALELELMKPAPAKPAKDFFGQTVALVRRFRDAEERNATNDPEPPSLPPEAFLNYYGQPIKPAVPHERGTATPGDEHHEGHRTGWYVPPSWSSIRKPDPCPSRKEKLQRKLRSMSNSAFRRLQHRNSRGL